VANRFQPTLDNACRGHRSLTRGHSASSLNDPTLQKSDAAMTPKGFAAFQSAETLSITSSDFIALSQARSSLGDLRAALAVLERADPSRRRLGADSSLDASARQSEASSPAASAVSAKWRADPVLGPVADLSTCSIGGVVPIGVFRSYPPALVRVSCISPCQPKGDKSCRRTTWPGSAEPFYFPCSLSRMQRSPSGSSMNGLQG
jgi:hypothetical protein